MKNNERYSDREWEKLASILSDEKEDKTDLLGRFVTEEGGDAVNKWKEMGHTGDNKKIDVDRAWNNVYSRISEEADHDTKRHDRVIYLRRAYLRIAAIAAVVTGLALSSVWMANPDFFSKKITVATSSDQKNVTVGLPDGSNIVLNRNSELTYRANFGTGGRKVSLSGEAFFDIAPDKLKPFIIDAGRASIRVVGTSFNVMSNNSESEVEVFVKTGKVLLTGNTGKRSVTLEPGYVGTMGSNSSGKKLNSDPNYLSWNTGLLVYNGQKLDIVFGDLKRVYNMNIVADDSSILDYTWTSPIDNQPQETIIRLICASFNLSYSKEGDVYHLNRK